MPTTKAERTKKADEILERGVIVEVIPSFEDFRCRLISDKPLRIYIGADPTSSSLHLSHAKNYMLLEEFRQMGHEVIVLFGDFTAKIGDPTDRFSVRQKLSEEEIRSNVSDWIRQITPLMDFEAFENPPKIRFNGDWLRELTLQNVIELATNTTVQQMLERDMFERRLQKNRPIYLHEFLYPLMQGFDSVAMDVDAELCGTDQIFNALVGRTLQKRINYKDKFIVVVNLMENPKTGKLMSKSLGTGVFLDSSPKDMYGSIMSVPDEMIEPILVNNTRISKREIQELLCQDPRDAKMRAAFLVTSIFYGEESATFAEKEFVMTFQEKKVPSEITQIVLHAKPENAFVVVRSCLDNTISNSEIRRLFRQGAVRFNGKNISSEDSAIQLTRDEIVVNVGKRKWFKVVFVEKGDEYLPYSPAYGERLERRSWSERSKA